MATRSTSSRGTATAVIAGLDPFFRAPAREPIRRRTDRWLSRDAIHAVELADTHIAPVLVFGYGNPSRGDDALAPRLLERLEADSEASQSDLRVEFLTDFQLQVEHALDLVNRELVLFADAHVRCRPPFEFARIAGAADRSFTTHAMSPAAVLEVFQRIQRKAPPPSFLLSLRGESFELGAALSDSATGHLSAAYAFVKRLLAEPCVESWQHLADG